RASSGRAGRALVCDEGRLPARRNRRAAFQRPSRRRSASRYPRNRRGALFDHHGKQRRMTKIIAVANQKGGVGRPTTSVDLAASLAAMKRRVLLLGLDPQGNATMGAGVDKRALTHTVYHVLLGEKKIGDVRMASPAGGFDLVPANRELAGAEVELIE